MSLRILCMYLTLSFCSGAQIEKSGCELAPGRSGAVTCDYGDSASEHSAERTELSLEGCEGDLDPEVATKVRRLVMRRCDEPLTPHAFSTLQSLTDLTLQSNHFRSDRYPLFCNNNKLINLTIVDTTFGGESDEHFVKTLTRICNQLNVLSLNEMGITRISENDFDNAMALTSLDLSSNSIRIVEGESFKNLNNLRYLSLFYNELSSLSTNVFTGLSSLEILRLDQNNLQTLPDRVFDRLQHLKELILSGNSLRHVNRAVFENMKTIEKLSLAENDIINVDQLTFNKVRNLRSLDLSSNNIEELSVDIFVGLSNLESLHLENNNIKNIQPRAFAPLSAMKTLNLSVNNLETLSGDPFTANNSALKSLNLAGNNIRNLQPRCFIDLVNLEKLNVSYNQLETFPDDALGGGDAILECLDLSHNRLSRLGAVRAGTLRVDHNRLSAWGGRARVSAATLHHNPWQCACARAMLRELRARRVAVLDAPPLDGKAPQCVVLPAAGCLPEPHALPGYEDIIDSFIEHSYKY